MSNFVNTVDVIGDDALIDSIIDKSITEIVDDKVTHLRTCFWLCESLKRAIFPNVTTAASPFYYCYGLEEVYFPELTAITGNMFYQCQSLKEACFPKATSVGGDAFNGAGLEKLDLPVATSIHGNAFYHGYAKHPLNTLILRADTMCTLTGTMPYTQIAKGAGYIYVPRALLSDTDAEKDYRRATNWSTYATQFRVLEDYTADGTVTGDFVLFACSYVFAGVNSTNTVTETGPSYTTTLAATDGGSISEVTITMGGVDITAEVYNAETGEINIPLVTGDLAITAKAASSSDYDAVLTPYDGSDEGELPYYKLNVTAGQTVTVTYFLTKAQGYVYDGRNCGLQYYGSVNGSAYPLADSELNTETIKTLQIPSNGTLAFSGFRNDTAANGSLAANAGDRAYGKYIKVKVEG